MKYHFTLRIRSTAGGTVTHGPILSEEVRDGSIYVTREDR